MSPPEEPTTDGRETPSPPPGASPSSGAPPSSGASPSSGAPPSSWGRLMLMARPRATRANAVAALLAILLGFAVATQVQQTQNQDLSSLRQPELIGLLDSINKNAAELDDSARELQATRDQLVSGSTNDEAALKAAQDRLAALGVLAGTVPASGPGIRMVIDDPAHKVTPAVLLDALEELRDAGAEAVQIGPVRIVASTYFTQAGEAIGIDGVSVPTPYRILAIGDAQTLSAAMDIPGGISETVRGVGATVTISQEKAVDIDALHTLRTPRYARPVPAATPTGTGG